MTGPYQAYGDNTESSSQGAWCELLPKENQAPRDKRNPILLPNADDVPVLKSRLSSKLSGINNFLEEGSEAAESSRQLSKNPSHVVRPVY